MHKSVVPRNQNQTTDARVPCPANPNASTTRLQNTLTPELESEPLLSKPKILCQLLADFRQHAEPLEPENHKLNSKPQTTKR